MADHTYKVVQLVGSAPDSIEAAIDNAVAKAAQTLHGLRWFEVVETRGHIEGNKVAHYQVKLQVGFTLD